MKALESLIPSPIAEAAGTTFMHSLWQLAAVAVLLMLVLAAVPRKAARSRYYLGVAALTLMLALPIATFFISYSPLDKAATSSAQMAATPVIEPGVPLSAPLIEHNSGISAFAGVSELFSQNAYLIVGIWLMGAMLFTLRFLGGFYRIQKLKKRETSPVPPEIKKALLQLQKKMGIGRNISILQSGLVNTPMVLGALRPVILLPLGLVSGLTTGQVECILAHELAHIRRWDYLVNLLQSMIEIVVFYHPAVWRVSKFVREERENCCDETVLALKHNKLVYARALLNLEAMRSSQPGLAMAANGGSLFRRIKRITGGEAAEKRAWSRGILVGMMTLGLVLLISTAGKKEMKASGPLFNLMTPEFGFFEEDFSDQVKPEEKRKETASTNSSKTDEKSESSCDVKSDKISSETFRENYFGTAFRSAFEVPVAEVLNLSALLSDQVASFRPLAGKMDDVEVIEIRLDSPETKVILQDGARNVEISLDESGEVVQVLVNGKQASEEEQEKYKHMANKVLRKYLREEPAFVGNNVPMPAMPPMPPMPAMRGIPPMPSVPALKNMPSPPSPADGEDLDKAEFKKRMKSFEKEMETWGENLEKEMQSGDWKKFEKEMEAWGEKLGKSFENADWDKYSSDMEAWGEDFAKNFSEKDWEKFGEKMEDFGEKWEEVGERIAEKFEDWAEEHEGEWEELAERMAEKAERMAEHAEETAERESEHAQKLANRYSSAVNDLEDELDDDGLANKHDGFKLKINEDELYVNGDKQSAATHKKYKRLVERMLNTEVGDDWIRINHKKNTTRISE